MIPAQYTNSLWALATAPIPEEIETHVAFLAQNKMVAAATDGTIHLYQFSPDGAINRVEVNFFPYLSMKISSSRVYNNHLFLLKNDFGTFKN